MEPTVDIFSDDDSVSKAPNLSEWRDMLIEASAKFGKEMGAAKKYKQWMIEAGFTDVTEEIFKVGSLLMTGGSVSLTSPGAFFAMGQRPQAEGTGAVPTS